jgi:hypothetical protein
MDSFETSVNETLTSSDNNATATVEAARHLTCDELLKQALVVSVRIVRVYLGVNREEAVSIIRSLEKEKRLKRTGKMTWTPK